MQQNNKPLYKKWWGILLIILLSLILIFLTAFVFQIFNIAKNLKNKNIQSEIPTYSSYKTNSDKKIIEGETVAGAISNYWIGSASPKITIVEFADFSCPMCKNFFTKIREISLKYKNDIKIIFRDYPVYENSLDLSIAARCAGEQGLFWLMHDKLFANQGNFELEQLPDLANQIGADVNKFKECLDTKKYLTNIKKDYSDAEYLKISGTPTCFINGYKIEGDIPSKIFTEIIEKSIK